MQSATEELIIFFNLPSSYICGISGYMVSSHHGRVGLAISG